MTALKMLQNKYKKLSLCVLITALIYLLVAALFERVVVNVSDSHTGYVFWKTHKKPSHEDYVYFEFEHELLPKKIKTLSKQLVCIAGDTLRITEDLITCNDKTYSIERMESTSSNQALPQFYYHGIVPDNQSIVYGVHQESFDSRYWGFVEYGRLKTMWLIY